MSLKLDKAALSKRRNMAKNTTAMALGLGFAAAMMAAPAMAHEEGQCCHQEQPSVLNLNVTESVSRAPDIATISAGVVTQARTANQAMADNRTRMAAAMTAVKAAGIADRDIQTSGISIQPQYEYRDGQRPRITGYQVSNTMIVRIRDLTKVGPVLDRVVELGVNQVDGPTFGIDNPDAALDEARREAISTAMARANLYATGAGMRVHRVISINESGGYEPPRPQPMMMARMAAADAAVETAVAPGELKLQITLNLQVELEPADNVALAAPPMAQPAPPPPPASVPAPPAPRPRH